MEYRRSAVPLESTCGAAKMTVDAASTTTGLKLPLGNFVIEGVERSGGIRAFLGQKNARGELQFASPSSVAGLP